MKLDDSTHSWSETTITDAEHAQGRQAAWANDRIRERDLERMVDGDAGSTGTEGSSAEQD